MSIVFFFFIENVKEIIRCDYSNEKCQAVLRIKLFAEYSGAVLNGVR